MAETARQYVTENGYRLRIFGNEWQWFGPDTNTILDKGSRVGVASAISYYVSVLEQDAAIAALTK